MRKTSCLILLLTIARPQLPMPSTCWLTIRRPDYSLAELRGVTLAEDGALRIGSATTFTQLIENPLTQCHLPALCAAASSIAGPQIRNVATYGGNICNGATSADSATPTLIYDAKLEIHSPRGIRFVPINEFHTGPGKVSLEHDEILVAFHFPPPTKSTRW